MKALLATLGLLLTVLPAQAETVSLKAVRANSFVERSTLQPGIHAILTPESAEAHADFLRRHDGKALRVRIGGEDVDKPAISPPASDGAISITGDLTVADATAMAKAINDGAAIEVSPAPPERISLEAERASATFDSRSGEPVVSIILTEASAKVFAEFTTAHVGRKVAFSIGGNVLATPIIREPILGGSTQISGDMTVQDATALAKQIYDGARIDVEVMPRR